MIKIKPLHHDKKSEAFRYAVERMTNALHNGMTAFMTLKYDGATTDFLMTVHGCGDLPLLKKAYWDDYNKTRYRSTAHVMQDLEIEEDVTVLTLSSDTIYDLFGFQDEPFKDTIISGEPMLIFSNFVKDHCHLSYDVTLSIMLPNFIHTGKD